VSAASPPPYTPPPYVAPAPAATPPAGPMPEQEARQWAMAAHLSALTVLIGIPGFIGPLVVWLLKKDQSAYVDVHGKESLNFQISLLIYFVVSLVLILVLIGIALLVVLGILAIVLPIIAGVKASNGETWRYPLTIRFLK
jgi:uncharacterized Tic20 family protein